MNGQAQQKTLVEAQDVTRALAAIVLDENQALRERNIDLVGEKINEKNRLAVKLEKLLAEAKAQVHTGTTAEKAVVPAGEERLVKAATLALQAEMDAFQAVARKNMVLLKSAHQVRADTLKVIQDTVNAQKPKAEVYGENGGMAVAGGVKNPSLLNRTV